MVAESPQIVGIVGGSCAGKSWLCEALRKRLGSEAVALSLDDFYRDRSHLSPQRRRAINFDHPRAIDWPRLERVLTDLAQGRAARVPSYDFARHGRAGQDRLLSPAPVVIVEGLWLFRRPAVRKLFDLRLFIRSPDELCLERRLCRDVRERGRTREEVLAQFERFTLPMFTRFVAPQERWADLVLEAPVSEAAVDAITSRISKRTANRISNRIEHSLMAVGI